MNYIDKTGLTICKALMRDMDFFFVIKLTSTQPRYDNTQLKIRKFVWIHIFAVALFRTNKPKKTIINQLNEQIRWTDKKQWQLADYVKRVKRKINIQATKLH